METLKHAIIRQWGLILLAVLSIGISLITKLPTWVLAPVSVIVILANEAIEVKRSHRQKLLEIASKVKEQTQDFQQRFISSGSTFSIFYLIRELSNAKSEEQDILRAWESGCSLGQEFLENWLLHFMDNLNLVVQRGVNYEQELSRRCKEFWRMNRTYYRLVEEFYNRAEVGNLLKHLETHYNEFVAEYNEFVAEYNEFVRILRETMSESKDLLHLDIDSKSIDFAKELRLARLA